MHKIIYDITKFSALDYEHHLSAVLWFAGCNMRCPYCHNSDIVFAKNNINKNELFTFLKSRVGKLEAIVLSGGECTLYKDLPILAKDIKELGFKVKIDTNGTNPNIIKKMVDKNLIDFISLDFKAPKEKYTAITSHKDFSLFLESLIYLIKKEQNFEVRTTVHTDILDENDINTIIKELHHLNFKGTYYIQNYVHQDKILGNLQEQTKIIDKSKIITNLINIEFRNF